MLHLMILQPDGLVPRIGFTDGSPHRQELFGADTDFCKYFEFRLKWPLFQSKKVPKMPQFQ